MKNPGVLTCGRPSVCEPVSRSRIRRSGLAAASRPAVIHAAVPPPAKTMSKTSGRRASVGDVMMGVVFKDGKSKPLAHLFMYT